MSEDPMAQNDTHSEFEISWRKEILGMLRWVMMNVLATLAAATPGLALLAAFYYLWESSSIFGQCIERWEELGRPDYLIVVLFIVWIVGGLVSAACTGFSIHCYDKKDRTLFLALGLIASLASLASAVGILFV